MQSIGLRGKAGILQPGKGFCHLEFPWPTNRGALLYGSLTRVKKDVSKYSDLLVPRNMDRQGNPPPLQGMYGPH